MEKKLIISVVFIVTFLVGCKNKLDSKLRVSENQFDTIYYETKNHLDTLLFPVKNKGKSIWINKILFEKNFVNKKIIIAYSLSDNNYVFIDNINDSLEKKILGTEIEFNNESFKDYDLVKIESKSYNSGNLINSINVFYINNKLRAIKNDVFFINSTDNCKTFDKEIYLVKNTDSIQYKVRNVSNVPN